MQLSKNVIRSMKTEIKNKREKAAKYFDMAQGFNEQAEQLERLIIENSNEPTENVIAGVIVPDRGQPEILLSKRLTDEQLAEQADFPPIPQHQLRRK